MGAVHGAGEECLLSTMPDFEARAIHYFQRWSTHEFRPVKTEATALSLGFAVPIATWMFVSFYTGDRLPWKPVLLVTLLYGLLAPLLVRLGRKAAVRAAWHVSRLADELTNDVRRAASWEFLVNHFRSIHPVVVHTAWFRELLGRAAAQCDRPASRALARWLTTLPPAAEPTVAPPADSWLEHHATQLREQALGRLRWLGQQTNVRALAAANRVRSPRIFQRGRFSGAQQFALAYFASVGALAFWAYLTGSRRLNVLFVFALLAGVLVTIGYALVKSWRTGVAFRKLGARFDRRFSPVHFWIIEAVGAALWVAAFYWLVRFLPLLSSR